MSDGRPQIDYQPASIDDFNKCKYLYLRGLQEPKDNSLRLVIEEAVSGRASEPLVIGRTSIPTNLIETLPGCRVFVVNWKSYYAFTVTNESSGIIEGANDKGEGTLFRVLSSSVYLDFIRVHTYTFVEPDPRRHWSIYCQNHVLDVVSVDEPEIQMVRAQASPESRTGVSGWRVWRPEQA